MATANATIDIGKVGKLSTEAQKNVIQWVQNLLMANKQDTGFQEKMDAIDVAYARYKEGVADGTIADGKDARATVACGNAFADDDITPPIVVSQVDSYVAYLADVFLSGSPMFPVVSNPSNKKWAEQLETLMDDHASLGGYARQFLLFIRDCVKYNYGAIEADWDAITQFSVAADFESGTGSKVKRAKKFFTKVKRLNPRNVIRDMSVDPGDISATGDYAGHVELLSKMKFKRLLNDLTDKGAVYNADKAIQAMHQSTTGNTANYRNNPTISKYTNNTVGTGAAINWASWFAGTQTGERAATYGSSYEIVTVYGRILPSDFAISAPQRNTPQIWKFRVVNGSVLISAERIVSAYDALPILFGQPLEDGLGYQTKSTAEGAISYQDAAATLYNIRFAAARRAVSDRALYVADSIDEKDVNAKGPAPKIPVRMSVLSNKTLDQVYKSIPFESRGLETVMQDAQTIVAFGQQLSGLNNPQTGQFQKGNKSVQEWNDTMGGSDNRLRLPALVLEHQVFAPFKSICTLNIFQYGENMVLISQKTGQEIKIDVDELRKQVLSFRIADGYTPKSKLASTDAIAGILQLISTSPILQQVYGPMLPGMVAHLAQLQGVRGLDEYDPKYQNTLTQPAGLPVPNAPVAPVLPAQAPALADPAVLPPDVA